MDDKEICDMLVERKLCQYIIVIILLIGLSAFFFCSIIHDNKKQENLLVDLNEKENN